MKTLPFFKYHGTGNDFVMVDQREQRYLDGSEQALIARLCHRHFGIGADGLILLQLREGYDFEMVYFNSDGRPSSMCGNGARCTVAFAHALGIRQDHYHFLAPDGPHQASLPRENWAEVEMKSVGSIEAGKGFYFVDTGSPHYVRFVADVNEIDTVQEGRSVRYSERFRSEGTNVNFVAKNETGLQISTYERGVENETLSCGTGVTAAAITAAQHRNLPPGEYRTAVHAKGGELVVRFRKTEEGQYYDIWLCGPAKEVFQGSIALSPLMDKE
jgi:diaminopimelate epimerase